MSSAFLFVKGIRKLEKTISTNAKSYLITKCIAIKYNIDRGTIEVYLKGDKNCKAVYEINDHNITSVKVYEVYLINEHGDKVCMIKVNEELTTIPTIVPLCTTNMPGIYTPCIVLNTGQTICLNNTYIVVQP